LNNGDIFVAVAFLKL